MKLVEFTRDMRPQRAGERRVVPDPVAQRLIQAGDAVVVASAFDNQPRPEQPGAQARPSGRGVPYQTRKLKR